MKRPLAAAAIAALCLPHAAAAQDSRWFFRAGPAAVVFSPSAKVKVGGQTVPGASVGIDNDATLTFDVGYRVTDAISVTFTGGIPPLAVVNGGGPLDGMALGKVRYAPAVLGAQYQFKTGTPFKPYVGAGLNYTLFFDAKDGAVEGLKVDNAFGPVLQVGFNYEINEGVSLYGDVKQIWLDTTAKGTVGGAPAEADLTADPMIIGLGVSYRF